MQNSMERTKRMKHLKLSHFSMTCCKKQLLWLGETIFNYCPECGKPSIGAKLLKGKKITNFELIMEEQVVVVGQLEEKENE
jgi:predicted RNA-binding Zn-ribbon protein involved in translation (DUF1610 family)